MPIICLSYAYHSPIVAAVGRSVSGAILAVVGGTLAARRVTPSSFAVSSFRALFFLATRNRHVMVSYAAPKNSPKASLFIRGVQSRWGDRLNPGRQSGVQRPLIPYPWRPMGFFIGATIVLPRFVSYTNFK